MELQELLKKVRQIEFKTKKLSKELFSGNYASTFKGRGMSFSEVRAYTYGDDIRNIDWNVTSRSGEPFVKEYEEERELTFMLLIDISSSMDFGSMQRKRDFVAEIAATLAFSSLKNNDKVGVLFFTDRIEKYIPPKKGKLHILRIIRELLETEPTGNQTDIGEALRFLHNTLKKRTTAFILSDFLESNSFEKELSLVQAKHQIYGIRIEDDAEYHFENLGLIQLYNAEKETFEWVNAKNEAHKIQETISANAIESEKIFRKKGLGFAHLNGKESFVPILSKMFKG
jgi:uncharacterized protein (DUF58 family)